MNNEISIDKGIEEEHNNIQDRYDSSDSSEEMSKNDFDSLMDVDIIISNNNNNKSTKANNEYLLKSNNNRKFDPELANLQKVDIFVQQLPYFDKIKKRAFETFENIKRNLAETIALNEFRPGFSHWSNQLIVFIHEYGLFFTKEDHLNLIKLYFNVMLSPNVDLPTIDYCFSALSELLKKFDKISRKDLTIDWKPLYDLYLRIHRINDYSPELAPENIESSGFCSFVRYARVYFDKNSTKEMLEEWRKYMCPFDVSMSSAFERCKIFLPTILYEDESEYGYKLWLNEFLNLWTTFNSRNFWETHAVSLFSRVAGDNIGEIDWNPYIPYIFSNTLRGFGLPFGSKDQISLGLANSGSSINNHLSQAFVYGSDEITTLASWIVSMIGTGKDRNLCMEHIKKLFLALRSFYYPSNRGSWSANLFLFLKSLPEYLIKRIKKERRDKTRWYNKKVKQEHQISDDDITDFVNALKDVVFTAIFSKSNQSDAKKAFQYLTFLRSEIMLEPFLEKVYVSLESVIEPHRYTSILSCLVSVARELATYNPKHKIQTQLHVLTLLNSVLPGLDPNDSNKCFLTLQFLFNLLSCVVICNCQSAINYRTDLTEYEKELCFETIKFEDFIHEFFKRIFYIIDNLASDTSSESSASAAAASNQFSISSRNKNADENIYQAQMIQTLKVLIRQSSKPILKLIFNKVKNYINGNSYNPRAGRILASLCGYLCLPENFGNHAFDTFFNNVYENLTKIKDGKNYEQLLKDERGDIEVSWNFQLLAEISKANGLIILPYINRIEQLISWYRSIVNKEIIGYISSTYRNVIVSLSTIYPYEHISVDYDIVFDDEKEFFTQHLPIRDWACTGDLFNLNLKYHIPSVKELEVAIDFVKRAFDKSFAFLTDSILSNKNSDNLTSTSKEERNRELNFVNHIMYGASRLLKRSTKFDLVTKHINSSVDIGQIDTIDKGLGFEIANLNDPNHEYSKLSDEHKKIMLNLRQELIEFLIQLAEKLINKHTNETTLLQLISRILSTASITYGFFVNDFEKMWKSHYSNKSALQNKLLGKKNSLRSELIPRVLLQYQYRTFYMHTRLNDLDIRIINILFRLSTDSIYAIVRKDSQSQLFSLLSHYPYSNLLIVTKIVDLLQRCNMTNESEKLTHDQLKGCLYLLSGNNFQDSLMVKQNWSVIAAIWPALFKCQHFEKPSIQALLDKIYLKADKDFDSFDNRIKLPDNVIESCYSLCPQIATKYRNNEQRLKIFQEKSEKERNLIESLMKNLVEIAKESQLSWKNQATSYGAILYLLNSCVLDKKLLSVECVQLFVESLVHENINVRKIAVDALCIIIKMVKYKKDTKFLNTEDLIKEQTNNQITHIEVNKFSPGYRPDNAWHLYDPNFLINTLVDNELDNQKWQNTIFLDKSYWGYYCWPSKIEVNLNKRKIYSFDNSNHMNEPYRDAIKPIFDKFQNDAEFVSKFIKLSQIEESKGNEKFDKKRFYLFKSLFRNFGSSKIFNNLYEHLQNLITDKQTQTQECSHKLAAEIMCGLIRGSKYWSLSDLKQLWSKLKPLLDLVIENISTENVKLWHSCFSYAYEDQDPRRLTFYMNYFKDLAFKMISKESDANNELVTSTATSFQQSSCLQFLVSHSNLEWRIPLFWSSLIDLFLSNMSHPYKSIREKIGYCLALSLANDIDYSLSIQNEIQNNNLKVFRLENMNKFLNYLEVKLNQAIELFDSVNDDQHIEDQNASEKEKTNYKTPQHQSAINLLQTLFSWFGYYIYKSFQPVNLEIMRIIPQLCSVDKIAAQETTVKAQLPMIRIAVSMWMLDKNSSTVFLSKLKQVVKSKSWMTRLAGIQMLQNFGIFNLFLVNDEIKSTLKEIIIESLGDEQLEVRISANLALTGFIHSNFIDVDQDLISKLKSLSSIKAKKKDKESGKVIINMANLIKRHGGVLGLCSIVNSCPYDVPKYLPDVLTYLCQFINDPVPIQGSVRKSLSEFRRTHYDNWQEHKLAFDENQLLIISDILISPNYYA